MTDILIRGVSAEAIARIDAEAAALGLSRNEYLRRRLDAGAVPPPATMTMDDLRRFTGAAADLLDPEVMKNAWR